VPPALTYKPVKFDLQELKARDDGWTFSGYASTFGNVDEGGDVVLKGAFLDSLERRPSPKLLWQHDVGEPLGKVISLREDERGLFGEFKISRTTRGQDAYQLLKDGALDSMSIGYIPADQEFTGDGVRQLKAVDLLEISVVSIPMNEEALITSIKSAARHVPPHRVIAELKAWIVELEASAASDGVPSTTPPTVVVAVHKAGFENRRRRAQLLGLVVGDRAS
jgi:HK97 family phage prohead protease